MSGVDCVSSVVLVPCRSLVVGIRTCRIAKNGNFFMLSQGKKRGEEEKKGEKTLEEREEKKGKKRRRKERREEKKGKKEREKEERKREGGGKEGGEREEEGQDEDVFWRIKCWSVTFFEAIYETKF